MASVVSPNLGALPDSETRSVLVIETDPGVRWSLERGLGAAGFRVRTASTAEEAEFAIHHEGPFQGMLFEVLPEAGLSMQRLTELREAAAPRHLVCMSVDASPQTVVGCLRHGAADFLPKPFSLAEARQILAQGLTPDATPSQAAPVEAVADTAEPTLLVGVSPALQDLREVIGQVARTNLNCLIRGESGTGKDMVAREIHRLSTRSDKAFVKVNCGALPDQLLESELFGYEKGAFTGASTSKPGRFSLADGGIIFLDEIYEIDPALQAKLLQVIEHKEFTKLGGRKPIHVDVQIIAATNADLEAGTREGRFRQDLFFRLNEVCLWVPSLAERREDIPFLARHFVKKYGHYAAEQSLELTGEDLQALCNRPWPGNVRELESTIKRWLVLGRKELEAIPSAANTKPQAAPEPAPQAPDSPAELSPQQILAALEQHQWNRRKAAAYLGLSYQALRRRIEKHGIQ